jgi:hypothetical protein
MASKKAMVLNGNLKHTLAEVRIKSQESLHHPCYSTIEGEAELWNGLKE